MHDTKPTRLRAAGRSNPICPGTRTPVLTWTPAPDSRPGSYLIRAGRDPSTLAEDGGAYWSAAVSASASTATSWPGTPLQDGERIWWQVAAIDAGKATWSEPAFVEADPGDNWAEAILHPGWPAPNGSNGPLPQFRAVFTVPANLASARLYLSSPGVVAVSVDGEPVITGELEPGYSTPSGPTVASAWDITARLAAGPHVLQVDVGGGVAYVPALPGRYTKFVRDDQPLWIRCALQLTDATGVVHWWRSDHSWTTRTGPTAVAHWYAGEDHDDRLGGAWTDVAVLPGAGLATRWRDAPPVQADQVLAPAGVIRRPDGSRLIDFGVNVAGRLTLDLRHAIAARPIRCWPAELLDETGEIDQSTTGRPIYDSFTPAAGTARWSPRFGYHGARYWRMEGLSDREPDTSISFTVLRAANEPVGAFKSTHPFLSKLHELIQRAVRANMFSVFTDCPHREKLGWLEQLHYCFDALARTHDVHAHLVDMVRYMTESATPEGLVPSIAPELVRFDILAVDGDQTAFRDDPNWGRTVIELPWLIYRHYGDEDVLRLAMPTIQRYLDHLAGRAEDGLLHFGLGDWIQIDKTTPRSLVASTGWLYALRRAATIARLLGEHVLSERWGQQAEAVKQAVVVEHRSAYGVWGSGSQASWAMGWQLLDDPADTGRAAALAGLLDRIKEDEHCLTIGEIALPALIEALDSTGHADLLLRMISRPDAAGYGHQIAQGATTLTESWQGAAGEPGVASQNHFMLGAVDGWLQRSVAGLRQHPDDVGWRHVIIEPRILDGVDDAATTFHSPSGPMTVSWRRIADRIAVSYDVPAATTVDLRLPPGAFVM